MKKILVTGGAGFIGSHTALLLKEQGYEVSLLDLSFDRGYSNTLSDFEQIVCDIRNKDNLRSSLGTKKFDACVHFAALIEAGESVIDPWRFYDNNVVGTLNLLKTLNQIGTKKIVFSSTAAVYGNAQTDIINEEYPKNPINPYGSTKLAVEKLIEAISVSDGFSCFVLRYFNACGSDSQKRLGEEHNPETHLIPLILDAALGKRELIKVYGTDYPTPDGSCIRDYIHVTDLARGHLLALDYLFSLDQPCFDYANLGTGSGFSVLEVIEKVKQVTERDFKVEISQRREGDPARLVASAQKAKEVLGFECQHSSLENIIRTAWEYRQGLEL